MNDREEGVLHDALLMFLSTVNILVVEKVVVWFLSILNPFSSSVDLVGCLYLQGVVNLYQLRPQNICGAGSIFSKNFTLILL